MSVLIAILMGSIVYSHLQPTINISTTMNEPKIITSFLDKQPSEEVSLVGIEDRIHSAHMNKDYVFLRLVKDWSEYELETCSLSTASAEIVTSRRCAAWSDIRLKYAALFLSLADGKANIASHPYPAGAALSIMDFSVRNVDKYIDQAIYFEDMAALRTLQNNAARNSQTCLNANGPPSFFADCSVWHYVAQKAKTAITSLENGTLIQVSETPAPIPPESSLQDIPIFPLEGNFLEEVSLIGIITMVEAAITEKDISLLHTIKKYAMSRVEVCGQMYSVPIDESVIIQCDAWREVLDRVNDPVAQLSPREFSLLGVRASESDYWAFKETLLLEPDVEFGEGLFGEYDERVRARDEKNQQYIIDTDFDGYLYEHKISLQ